MTPPFPQSLSLHAVFTHLQREISNIRKSERDVALAAICLVALLTEAWVLIAEDGQTVMGT